VSESTTRFLQQENSRLQQEIEALNQKNIALIRHLNMVEELYWIAQSIAEQENPWTVIDDLLGKVMEVVDAADGSILCLDENTSELVFVLVQGGLRGQLPGFRLQSGSGISGWVVENQKPIIVNNPRQDWRFSLEVDEEFGFLSRSVVQVPVLIDDRAVGVISLVNKVDDNFTPADVALLLAFSQITATVMQLISPDLKVSPPQQEVDDLFGEEELI
jgi:signal transduction protein with GAF and PtsI domain